VAAADGETFLTFSAPSDTGTAASSGPIGSCPFANSGYVYRSKAGGQFTQVSFTVHSFDGSTSGGFVNFAGCANTNHLDTHPLHEGYYALAGGGGYSWVSIDGGQNWTGAKPLGLGALASNPSYYINVITSMAFEPTDASGQRFWAASGSSFAFDFTQINAATEAPIAVPDGFGHLFFTTNGGQTWQAALGTGSRTLPNVPVRRVQVDPGDANTVYVATDAGLYWTKDHGANFDRFGVGLPIVQVGDFCIAPGANRIVVATFGRGFWSVDATAAGQVAGVRGTGDLDFNLRLDAFDLIDLTAAMGASSASSNYRQQADLTGTNNLIDDADLGAFLSVAGGAP
jgi:hypothetical protein